MSRRGVGGWRDLVGGRRQLVGGLNDLDRGRRRVPVSLKAGSLLGGFVTAVISGGINLHNSRLGRRNLISVTGVESIGVCYGTGGNNLPSPNDVINLYKSKNIKGIRLYNPDQDALQALKDSNIPVILDVPDSDISSLASDSSAASRWVQSNIQAFSANVNFRYIAVGNQLTGDSNANNILPAMRNIAAALRSAGLQDRIKVSTAVSTGVLGTSYPPSAGAFSSDASSVLVPIIGFLNENGAPLLANVYPYVSYTSNPNAISLDYALFTSPGTVVTDGQLQYQNLFDAIVDSLYSALEKVGGRSISVVVSETGWPSDGGPAATTANAQTYLSNLIGHVSSGTPKRPGSIDAYIYAMFDENNQQPQGTVNHYGLFTPDKQPKYSISF
ncbi:glucan endo-1,3-beta-glucosidase-like [Dendrobium catenatum]|uniref:glucan endo-1,3-beta-glucosidase-like n=1 Tax=Dendrobium catenatum TaxID=906689 RepID=UPI0009F169FD|nr:glucan endo-1,3-beta-glucosidase-like [Dendrobium catenatum]